MEWFFYLHFAPGLAGYVGLYVAGYSHSMRFRMKHKELSSEEDICEFKKYVRTQMILALLVAFVLLHNIVAPITYSLVVGRFHFGALFSVAGMGISAVVFAIIGQFIERPVRKLPVSAEYEDEYRRIIRVWRRSWKPIEIEKESSS